MAEGSLIELMKARRSVRQFKSSMPDRALIEKLIEAAVTAPSASNKQPWRFLIIADRKVIERLGNSVREAVQKIASYVEPSWEQPFRSYGDYFTRFQGAPVVIVPLYRSLTVLSEMVDEELPQRERESIRLMEINSGLISTSLALQNLLLMAHTMGLGASVMTGPLVALETLRGILEVPESWQILAVIPVGFSAEEPMPTTRKPIDKVIRWIAAGEGIR